jgi:hemerythrin
MMIDADGFKPINDTFGHDAGDVVLRELAQALRDGVRTDDVVCRLGGDEFFILCPRTALADGLNVAEKLRGDIASLRVPAGTGTWHGSISVGVAENDDLECPEILLKVADDGVYAAKRGGRNRVATVQKVG